MSDLDDLRNIAVDALVAFHQATHSTLMQPYFDETVSSLARQYITAQANYTNALRDWEVGGKIKPRRYTDEDHQAWADD